MTGVAETSIENYHLLKACGELSRMQRHVVGKMARGRDYSRAELAELADMRLSSVCGRVNELLNMVPPVLAEAPKRACKITGRTVHPVFLVPDQFKTGDLFDS